MARAERQPLIPPGAANDVCSMDFVFDRVATVRTIKSLAIVDDATHESVAIAVERSLGGTHLTRILSDVARGKASLRLSVLTMVRSLWAMQYATGRSGWACS
jgi:hypothetical protein